MHSCSCPDVVVNFASNRLIIEINQGNCIRMLHCSGGVWFLVLWQSVSAQDRVGAKLWHTVASGSRHGLQFFIELRCRLVFKSNMWCQMGVSPSSVVFLFVWYGTLDCFRNHIHVSGKFVYSFLV